MITSSGVFIIRTFAICERNWVIFVILTIPALGIVTSLIVHFNISNFAHIDYPISFAVVNS